MPVQDHCATKCGFECLAMSITTKNESGTVRTEMMASNGLIHTIIANTPMTVRIDVTSWVSVC